jgi:integrase
MPRKSEGQIIERDGSYSYRCALGPKLRPCFALPTCRTLAEAEERRVVLVGIVEQFRRAGKLEEAPKLLEMAAARVKGRPLEAVLAAVEQICSGDVAKKTAAGLTIREFAEQWTDGTLHARHPDHIKVKRSVEDDISRFKTHIFPVVEKVRVMDFTLDHALAILSKMPAGRATNTRRSVALLVNHLIELAVFPCRIIERNPLPRGWAPKPGKRKAVAYLYPDEDAQLMQCADVPLLDRLVYGVLAREGMRTTELLCLTWSDFDLKRGTVALDRNKTDDPRTWVLDPGVAEGLRAWRDRYRPDARPDLVFVEEGQSANRHRLAGRLRAHLRRAGISRPVLFEKTAQRQPVRAHDLRGTFVTLSLASGRTETWVADRTGHKTSQMINRYRQPARSATELGLGWLRPLDEVIPELGKGIEKART